MTRLSARVVPSPEAIAGLTEQIFGFLRGHAVDARAINHVGLVVEELLTNVASHGGNASDEAEVVIDVEPDRIVGEIRDRGTRFDPRTAATPDLTAPAERRAIGGLGLHLVRRLTSALDYRRDGDQNWTAFCIAREMQAKG